MLKLFTENEAAKFMTRAERKTCKNTLKNISRRHLLFEEYLQEKSTY